MDTLKIQPYSLDAILLFALTIPVIMKYGLSSGETPYWLFTLLFVVMLGNLFISSIKIRSILTWIVIILTIGSVLVSSILVRNQTSPEFGVHDIILQLESAIRFFLGGVNPYATDYFGTPLEHWHYSDTRINPALYHFVMPPWYLLFSIPFYALSISFFGFFDGRLPLIFCFFGTLFVLSRWVEEKYKPLALILFAFNPATIDYFIEGRSDFFMHFFLILSLWLLYKKHVLWSAVILAFAFAVKQSVWPFFPLYWFFMYRANKKHVLPAFVLFSLVFTLIVGPFLLWDAKAFFDSTVNYLSGIGNQSYPISGYGFGMLLLQAGIINNVDSYFPFTFFQIAASLPVLYGAIRSINHARSVKNLLFWFGMLLFVFWYFSRYFNNSHIGYISALFMTSYFIPDEHHEKT